VQSVESKEQPPLLEAPLRITEQVWPEGTTPVVSIWCITYNHADFIRDAIGGFLSQETTFPVEIFIHDDASSDGTADIVRGYADEYPGLFWTVLQAENQCSKGNAKVLFNYLAKQRGEYVALCEGDDYWTDPCKLQKQRELMASNRAYTLCHHKVIYKDHASGTTIRAFPEEKDRVHGINGKRLVEYNFIQTCSAMLSTRHIRSANLQTLMPGLKLGDWPLFVAVSQNRRIAYIDETMAVYRLHSTSYWRAMPASLREKHCSDMSHRLASRLPLSFALAWWLKISFPFRRAVDEHMMAGSPIAFSKAWWALIAFAWNVRSLFALFSIYQGLRRMPRCLLNTIRLRRTPVDSQRECESLAEPSRRRRYRSQLLTQRQLKAGPLSSDANHPGRHSSSQC
jgi:glycosyltransferase involved in cell wall biosynthesis